MNLCLWLTVPPHGRATLNSGVLMSSVLSTLTTAEKNKRNTLFFWSFPWEYYPSVNVFGTEMSCYSDEHVRERGHSDLLFILQDLMSTSLSNICNIFSVELHKSIQITRSLIQKMTLHLHFINSLLMNGGTGGASTEPYKIPSSTCARFCPNCEKQTQWWATAEACSHSPDLFSLQIREGLHMYCPQHPPARPVYWWVSDDQGRLSLEAPMF